MSGGKRSKTGTPQGGVISPLLANVYMHRFLRYWAQSGKGEVFRARIINYADDFVILSRGKAREALSWTKEVMTCLKLTLNRCDWIRLFSDFGGHAGCLFQGLADQPVSRRMIM